MTKNQFKTQKGEVLIIYEPLKLAVFNVILTIYYTCAAPRRGCSNLDLNGAFLSIDQNSKLLANNSKKILFPRCSKKLLPAVKVGNKSKKALGLIAKEIAAFNNPQLVCK